jgi:hypothetical protein
MKGKPMHDNESAISFGYHNIAMVIRVLDIKDLVIQLVIGLDGCSRTGSSRNRALKHIHHSFKKWVQISPESVERSR